MDALLKILPWASGVTAAALFTVIAFDKDWQTGCFFLGTLLALLTITFAKIRDIHDLT